ncbi:MAG: ATPase [Lachnospiraceae bacterium]|nr:ATPase [Lachnospiraceae bacterium]
MKKYTIIAGVNGAGKSTFYQLYPHLKNEHRVNADDILREFKLDWHDFSSVLMAGKEAVKRLNIYIDEGISFNQETTLCGKTVINSIKKAKEKGFIIELHYIGLDNAELAKERVAHRVSVGGHGVSDYDIERRYEESFTGLEKVLPLCNLVAIYDNTKEFRRFAIYKDGSLVRKSHNVPNWFCKRFDNKY